MKNKINLNLNLDDLPRLLLLYSTFFCGGESGRFGLSERTTFDDE